MREGVFSFKHIANSQMCNPSILNKLTLETSGGIKRGVALQEGTEGAGPCTLRSHGKGSGVQCRARSHLSACQMDRDAL